jgi:hypothetical protein
LNDLDALLEQYGQPTKSNKPTHPPVQQHEATRKANDFLFDNPAKKLPVPTVSKYDTTSSDHRKANPPLFSHPDQSRGSILKKPPQPAVDQSFDIDAILQGRSMQAQKHPSSKLLFPAAPTRQSPSSPRRDSTSDWLSDEPFGSKAPTQKVTTTTLAYNKPVFNMDPDDFFSNTNHNRDFSATKAPMSTTKTSARQYYLGNARYKPGVNPRQTGRRDSFGWPQEPSSNSNSASTNID